jgi:hypothetical protein
MLILTYTRPGVNPTLIPGHLGDNLLGRSSTYANFHGVNTL